MKKWLILTTLSLTFHINSFADNLDTHITYTGNVSSKAADTNLDAFLYGDLGGTVPNDFIQIRAFQFTVDQPLEVNHLSIDATATPNEPLVPTSPLYNTPLNMPVSFKLYDSTAFAYGQTNEPIPNLNSSIVSSNYTFSTENGAASKDYTAVALPFDAELQPGKTYWISAEDPQYSGVNLKYEPAFVGNVNENKANTPEPTTWILFGIFFLFIIHKGKTYVAMGRMD
jgi:hypothetical protein